MTNRPPHPSIWQTYYAEGKDFSRPLADEAAQITAYVDTKLHPHMLDIGCGTGRMTRAFARLGFAALGIDFAASAIERAETDTTAADLGPNARDNLTFRLFDFETQEPSELGSDFALVASRAVYAFAADRLNFLQRATARLAPTGTLALGTPLHENLPPERHAIGVDRQELEHTLTLAGLALADTFDANRITYFVARPQS